MFNGQLAESGGMRLGKIQGAAGGRAGGGVVTARFEAGEKTAELPARPDGFGACGIVLLRRRRAQGQGARQDIGGAAALHQNPSAPGGPAIEADRQHRFETPGREPRRIGAGDESGSVGRSADGNEGG